MIDKREIMRLATTTFGAGDFGATRVNFTVDDAGMVSCNASVWTHALFVKMPVKFKHVAGSFTITDNFMLETLEGVPSTVDGSFTCRDSLNLQTLQGAPTSVGGSFICSKNANLVSLVGAPESVPEHFDCRNLPKLKSLEGLPTYIGGRLRVTYNRKMPLLRSLVAQKGVDLTRITKILPQYPSSAAETVEKIINAYAGQGKRAMFHCQKALEEAGFKENARW